MRVQSVFKTPTIPTKVGTQCFPAESGLAEGGLSALQTYRTGQDWIPTFVGMIGLKKGRGSWKATILLLPLLLALPAASAPAPTDDGQIPDLVSALVVQAYTPGPAWWKVTHDGVVIWILGAPPYLSNAIKWDMRPLERRLKGADRLITPLPLTLQPYRVDAKGRRLPEPDGMSRPGETVADLPPATQARLRAAYKVFSDRPVSGDWSVIYATRQLNQVLFDRVPLSDTALIVDLGALGRAARVQILPTTASTVAAATDYVAGPVEPKIVCLEASMAVAEQGPNPLRQGLEAWARGDLPSAMATVGCVGAKGRVYQQEGVNVTRMIEAYLTNPGKGRKAVAAVELIPLLMKGGVIERLNADGYEIEAPDSAALMIED
ncbi:MAG: TraB/GumN family protein [Caulobacteraceae bacterium]|nr:TraB/GumN family protein [Caulobacteraceae bacterium]